MNEEGKTKEAFEQFVVTRLDKEEYGIPIMYVESLIRMQEITRVPDMPDFIEGVINLRGRIIPILDLRKKFRFKEKGHDERTRIVVVIVEDQSLGLVVDAVSEVLRMSSEDIDELPPTISHVGTEYLSGVGKLENRLVIILNVEKILSELEKDTLKDI
ncbi:MAG: chemotaxis protein CheW [Elusimicrobiota bacterium]